MSLDVEEDFDPAILGLAVDTPARPPLTKGDSGHRFSSGRYNSADWVPRVEDQITARIVAQEEISPAHDVVDIVVKEEPIDIKVETVESSEIDLADLMDKPPTRPPTPRHPKARRVIHRMAGSRRFRPGIRLIRRPSLALPIAVKEEETESQARHVPDHLVDVAAAFGIDFVDRLEKETKANATTGAAMPPSVSDLFSALDDLPTAVAICNDIRASMGLPSLNLARSNRIPILRQVAKMREHLYITLAAALLLPNAPDADEIEIVEKGQKPIYLTPTSLDAVGKRLPNAFPRERAAIRSYMPYAYGEEAGKVRWQDGIGKIIGAEGGYRGKWADGDVHVFVDHSNILYGLLSHLYPSSSSSLPPRHLRTLSLPVLSLLLRRGRPTPPGTLHLVASSPLKQDLDPMVRLGFEVSVLKRVEILADEVEDPNAMKLTPKMMTRLPSSEGAVGGLKRYKEQGVDEILHLKILQKLNAREEPGTIVLATGDARGGQFNKDGFVGAVKEALKRGWRVELWSWSDGLSRAWRDVARRERWTEREFSIHLFDEWAEQLVEVLHES